MTHLQILNSATRTGTWKIADDESVLQLLVDGAVAAEIAPWTHDETGELAWWSANAGERRIGIHECLAELCRITALDAGVHAPISAELLDELREPPGDPEAPPATGKTEPLVDRLADLLAVILDEPLTTLPGSDPAGAINEPLQLRLAHFRPDLSEVAARLLEEAGR